MKVELLEMAAADLRLRAKLARDGSLFEGYHPRMRELHERHAARLAEILDTAGWPRRSVVGEEAADAAWLILQHAIGNPPLLRRGLALLRVAAAEGEASRIHVAKLEDRIRTLEGKDQLFGTQFDWDEFGHLSPLPIDDAAKVDLRRAELGLPPLAEEIRCLRARAAAEGNTPPRDLPARELAKATWLRSAGWRD